MHEKSNPLVSNLHDPRFVALRNLQTEKGRVQTGNYLIEGIRHLARAVEQNSRLEQLIVVPSVLSNSFGQKLVRKVQQSSVPCIRLTPDLYRELTLAAEPQGVGAVLKQQWSSIHCVKPKPDSLWLAVESVDLPGNLGTILRTAEAAGAAGIFMMGPHVDPWDPACVRASMGSLFSLRLVRCTAREFAEWARSSRVTMIASSPNGLLDFKEFRCRWPAVLLIGSERQGLSQQLMDGSDFVLRIPMHNRCDSINASVAAGILLFEISNQLGRTVPVKQK